MKISSLADARNAPGVEGKKIIAQSAALCRFHAAEDTAALGKILVKNLEDLLPGASFAIVLHEQSSLQSVVEVVHGDEIALTEQSRINEETWSQLGHEVHPLRVGERIIGVLLVSRRVNEEALPCFSANLDHYTLALLNSCMSSSTDRRLHAASSTLRALEAGVVLFREDDPEAITARFLRLCMDYFSAQAGAVFLVEDVDDDESALRLEQVLGLPERLLDCLVREDGAWWPEDLARREIVYLERHGADGELPELCNCPELSAIDNLIAAPLGYHGVVVGAVILFNADKADGLLPDKLETAIYLVELGAAAFHRWQLEAKAIENKVLEAQLRIASVMQSRLIPLAHPEHEHLDFAWRSVMSQQVGGDYLDCLVQEDGACHLTMADVAGHGIDSALLMSSFRQAYRNEALGRSPDELLFCLNEEVRHEVGWTGMFLTCAALRIDRDAGRFSFASGGHNAVLLYRAAEGRFEQLGASGPPLGLFDAASYEVEEYSLAVGDFLLLYTDGLVEAFPNSGCRDPEDMFGLGRLQEIARKQAAEQPARLVEAIYEDLESFTGCDRQEDDVSVLIVKRSC